MPTLRKLAGCLWLMEWAVATLPTVPITVPTLDANHLPRNLLDQIRCPPPHIRTEGHAYHTHTIVSEPAITSQRFYGKIAASSHQRLSVALPLSGRIVKMLVSLGESVQKGQTLCEVESFDLLDKLSHFKSAQALKNYTMYISQRSEQLFPLGAASLLDTQDNLRAEQMAQAAAKASLGQLDYLSVHQHRYMVRAPFAGKITQVYKNRRDAVAGALSDGIEPVVELAAESVAWVDISIPQELAGYLRQDWPAYVSRFDVGPNQAADFYLAKPLSLTDNRYREYRYRLRSGFEAYPIGTPLVASLAVQTEAVLPLPLLAVFDLGDQHLVWRRVTTAPGELCFVATPVFLQEAALLNPANAAIVEYGLKEGDEVVVGDLNQFLKQSLVLP